MNEISNDYIDYYGKNRISPVNQDISDFEIHLRRRQKLYRQCGIPTFAFDGATMLEVGPGGGHNALAPLAWGISHIDLVEPNSTGVDTIKALFAEHAIDISRYNIFNVPIEKYERSKQYDIVVAEGFLMYVSNWREICSILADHVKYGGVLVVTVADDVSGFVELMKRMIGQMLTDGIELLDDKVEALIPIFDPQLKSLRGVSRPTRDWIQDNIFNPAFSKDYSVSMSDIVEFFTDFDLLGSSPRMFTDYSWYKDVWYDEKSEYINQFRCKHSSLLLAGMDEVKLGNDCSNHISDLFTRVKKIENAWEEKHSKKLVYQLYETLSEGHGYIVNLPKEFVTVYEEIVGIIGDICEENTPNMANYPHFFCAFGRNEQYLGFMKI